jgi:hypothetical protein
MTFAFGGEGPLGVEEIRMAGCEKLQLARDALEMVRHLASGAMRVFRGNGPIDGLVLGESFPHPAGFGKQRATHPLEMGADRIQHFADSRQLKCLDHLPVEARIEFVETLQIAACKRRLLVSDVLSKLREGEKIPPVITLPTMLITKDNAPEILKKNGLL